MSEFRYNDNALALEEDLVEILSEASRETAMKQAEAEDSAKEKLSGGLARIAAGNTASGEAEAAIDLHRNKTAGQEIAEHTVRKELTKIARRDRDLVDKFLDSAKSG